ncbi:hypothetical protein HMPREF1317_0402 [Schaalia georgiae F0490]|uniref:Uncharacterized protein n=1 Tax=Schaalia georgiae F0490 TaxID=1125717 RepID=J1HQY4_9ACTO|nr:hypothetical protein HMPREF1317_0402 [Schaalia georgiae F0490]
MRYKLIFLIAPIKTNRLRKLIRFKKTRQQKRYHRQHTANSHLRTLIHILETNNKQLH